MLKLAILLFIIAAVFGLINLTAILRNKPTPKPSVFLHGIFAVTAVALVIYFIATATGSLVLPITSLVLFIMAALGGLILFAIDMRKMPVPKWLAVIHPIIAASGLVILIIYTIQQV